MGEHIQTFVPHYFLLFIMTHNELWLTYHQASRYNKPVTAQLVELEFQNHKLADLEDVLEHLFRQGFIEAQHRSLSYWENHSGQRLSASRVVEELLKDGAGKCPQSALKLVIGEYSASDTKMVPYPVKPIVHLMCGSATFTPTRMRGRSWH